jgi:hypothetical protein
MIRDSNGVRYQEYYLQELAILVAGRGGSVRYRGLRYDSGVRSTHTAPRISSCASDCGSQVRLEQ